MIKRVISDRLRHMSSLFRLRLKLCENVELPAYDPSVLAAAWPRKDARCLRNAIPADSRSGAGVNLSVCIPMYNVQDYIGNLLDQLRQQVTRYSFEVLLADDGSTDDTARIVREHVADDPRFRYFYQENGGISAARNLAIDNASGQYLAFVDADDEICEGFIERLMLTAETENADIVKGRYCLKRGKTLLRKGVASGYVWGGVYRAELFARVRFPLDYWYEDMVNLFLITPQAEKIVYIDDVVMLHTDVLDSASKRQSRPASSRALEHLYLVQELTAAYWELGLDDMDYLAKRLITECSGLMVRRTGFLGDVLQKQVFLACQALFRDNEIRPERFHGTERIIARAIEHGDFAAWKLSADL